jgi:hypothetical protein
VENGQLQQEVAPLIAEATKLHEGMALSDAHYSFTRNYDH